MANIYETINEAIITGELMRCTSGVLKLEQGGTTDVHTARRRWRRWDWSEWTVRVATMELLKAGGGRLVGSGGAVLHVVVPPVVVGRVGCHARIDDGIEGDLDCLHSFRFVSLSSQQSCCVAEQMHARTTGAIWVIQESSLVCRIVGYPTWSAKPSWSSRWDQSYKFSRLNKAVSVQVVTVKHRDYVTDIACYRRQHSVPNHRRVVTLFFFPIAAEGIRVRNNQAL
jgi:hypothetical protein